MGGYLWNIIIWLDQGLNVIFKGHHDLKLSARAYIDAKEGVRSWPRNAIDKLFFWQKDHCRKSFENEYKTRIEFIRKHRRLLDADRN